MKGLALALLLIPATLATTANAAPAVNCSVGAFKPAAYGTAQVRGVGDVDCWSNYAEVLVMVAIKTNAHVGLLSTKECFSASYCSWYRIASKLPGFNCYYTYADGAVKTFGGVWISLPSVVSGGLCTS
jgi:hypothetical protein